MTPEAFATQVRSSIIDQIAATYRNLLDTIPLQSATDPYWHSLLEFHQRLSRHDRLVLYSVVRQVAVDTVSNVFGVLDGANRMEGQTEDFQLLATASQQALQGNLQTLLLKMENQGDAKP
jgi:hypothetical protein